MLQKNQFPNMKIVLLLALAGSGAVLSGCHTANPGADRGSSAPAVVRDSGRDWSSDADAAVFLPRHPNRATHEVQFIPD